MCRYRSFVQIETGRKRAFLHFAEGNISGRFEFFKRVLGTHLTCRFLKIYGGFFVNFVVTRHLGMAWLCSKVPFKKKNLFSFFPPCHREIHMRQRRYLSKLVKIMVNIVWHNVTWLSLFFRIWVPRAHKLRIPSVENADMKRSLLTWNRSEQHRVLDMRTGILPFRFIQLLFLSPFFLLLFLSPFQT